MKVLVAGGSGFIGRALCRELSGRGHEVTVLTRRPSGASAGNEAVWDGRTVGDWRSLVAGCDAVVNLAGESVAQGRWSAARKAALRDSRILSTRALVSAFSGPARRPKVFLCASATGYYGDRADETLTEGSVPGRDFLARLCADWEGEALQATELGMRTVCLRFGVVLSKEGGALARMLLPFRLGLGGPLGSGRQYMSWVSLSDAAGLSRFALESELQGAVNVAAPAPATNREFTRALGRALKRPAFLRVPAFALRLGLGEMSTILLSSQRALPQKALEAGYSFRHPDLPSAFAAALA